jgi:hypothetical protein
MSGNSSASLHTPTQHASIASSPSPTAGRRRLSSSPLSSTRTLLFGKPSSSLAVISHQETEQQSKKKNMLSTVKNALGF